MSARRGRWTRPRLALSLAVLALVVASAAACGGTRVEPSGPARGWLDAAFKAHAGDDPAWSDADLDDGDWAEVDSALRPGTSIPGWAGIGWFRGWIDVPEDAAGRSSPIYGRFVGAAELFVDGRRQLAAGDPDAVVAGGPTPIDFDTQTPRWVTFPRPGRQLIAVRFASRDVGALHRVGFPAGFELLARPLAAAARPTDRALDAAFTGATVALALLHLLLFLFHRDRRENLHYSAAALGVAAIAVLDGALRSVTTAQGALLAFGGLGAAVALSALLLLRFYHAVFSPRLPRSYWLLLALGLAVALGSFAAPRALAYGFAGLVALGQFRVLIGAMKRKVNGAWIVGAGGVTWLLGATAQMLGDLRVVPPLGHAYQLGFFALLGSMSVYLARDIARDRADLARQLTEIGELSARQSHAMERYRTVFQTTGTGTIMFADDAVITLANDEWVKLTGYERPEIEGRMTWMAFFSDASLERMRAYPELRSRDPSSAPRTYEAELRDRRGRIHDGVVTIAMVPGSKERVGSFLDLTDLKRAQRQMVRADKMAALGQIIAGVAHEINNPNNFIHFNLPILRRYIEAMQPLLERELERDPDLELLHMRYDAFIADLVKLIENMEHGSTRISAIVSDLKNYVRGGEELEMTAGSVAKVVEQVMTLVGKQVQKMVARFTVTVDEPLPQVRMNAGKIEQVLINLLINAAQAADKEASWVELTARATDSGDAVEIRVADNGAGIPADSLEQIFEPFYTSKGRETGTGLGLSISQQIVEEHGGHIEVASELGQGSRFTVRLPVAPAG
ncbi:MAG: PAS domain S-box protein [Polyangiaceae bacterium]|nr:PAS domain S-box protein [Polyangiaceae bacterium]